MNEVLKMSKSTLLDSPVRKYAYRSMDEICTELGISPDGLSEKQAEKMCELYGENSFDVGKGVNILGSIRRAFINPFNIILFVLAVVSLLTDVVLASGFSKNSTTSVIIFVMILISGVVRLTQELKAKNAAEQLDKLIREDVSVKRDGKWANIPADELVVGDLVYFSAGDRIPADIRLSKTSDLFISQSAITGESSIVEKNSGVMRHTCNDNISKCDNIAFLATTVISGQGEGIVLAVGKNTLYGSFADISSDDKNSFRKGANSIAFVMLKFMAVLIPTVFILLGITAGKWRESFVFSMSVAVGLVPEMLPMVITACLAKGSLAMSKKQTIVKDINAMQSFGSMDMLCMDKTGTLTNESVFLEYYMDILGNESTAVLDYAYLNSFYHTGVRNSVDNAILACKTMPEKAAWYRELSEKYKKLDEIPFDHFRKFVSVLVSEKGGNTLVVKGDIQSVLSRCSNAEYKGKKLPVDGGSRSSVSAVVDEMLSDGMKVIAIASKEMGSAEAISADDESSLTLQGYLAFFDAPKESAKKSVDALKALKVTPKVLTGDHAYTAVSICRRVGIPAETVMTGAELDELPDLLLGETVEKINIFAELTPIQKVRIVAALRENGHSVGFLGDGINDIPVMNEADVGISVDTAVDAAKDAADIVLLQKDLTVLEEGILEGRRIFTNMLKYIKITASSNFGNIFSIVCASAFLPFLPMASIQILLLNLLYDIICIVLPWDNVDSGETTAPREWSGKNLGHFMLSFGPISSLFDIATFLFMYFILCPSLCGGQIFSAITDPDLQAKYIAIFQTGWFLESMWTQVLILHCLRTSKIPFIQSKPSLPVMLITIAGLVLFTGITFTGPASLLGLTTLPLRFFVFLTAAALLYMVLTSIVKYFYQKKYNELI